MESLLHPRLPQLILLGSGALLVVVGLLLTVVQFVHGLREATHMRLARGFEVGRSGVSVKTTYVGVLIVAIGALLEALGAYLWH